MNIPFILFITASSIYFLFSVQLYNIDSGLINTCQQLVKQFLLCALALKILSIIIIDFAIVHRCEDSVQWVQVY
jgi:hypothetical protein